MELSTAKNVCSDELLAMFLISKSLLMKASVKRLQMHLLYAIAITVNCHRKEYMSNICLTFSALWTKMHWAFKVCYAFLR